MKIRCVFIEAEGNAQEIQEALRPTFAFIAPTDPPAVFSPPPRIEPDLPAADKLPVPTRRARRAKPAPAEGTSAIVQELAKGILFHTKRDAPRPCALCNKPMTAGQAVWGPSPNSPRAHDDCFDKALTEDK